jgi:hypothetical protein
MSLFWPFAVRAALRARAAGFAGLRAPLFADFADFADFFAVAMGGRILLRGLCGSRLDGWGPGA